MSAEGVWHRWEVWVPPELDKLGETKVLAISLGLGALFNESVEAEKVWMRHWHPALECSPLEAILLGDIDGVVALVNYERGL
jgi:hypothetical protein